MRSAPVQSELHMQVDLRAQEVMNEKTTAARMSYPLLTFSVDFPMAPKVSLSWQPQGTQAQSVPAPTGCIPDELNQSRPSSGACHCPAFPPHPNCQNVRSRFLMEKQPGAEAMYYESYVR